MKEHNTDPDVPGVPGRPIVIAEVAQAHEGSLGVAHSFIDAVADSGADGIKFQVHIAEHESSIHDQFRVPISKQYRSRREYWERMEFTEAEWRDLRQHALERGLLFVVSPFSIQAVDMMEKIGIDYWKVASGEFFNSQLISRLKLVSEPLIVSTGMSTTNEIKELIINLSEKNHIILCHCTSEYPCPDDQVGLVAIKEFQNQFNLPVGLSDHSGCPIASISAMALGAELIEVHVKRSAYEFGPDAKASVTLSELALIAKAAKKIKKLTQTTFNKDEVSKNKKSMRKLFSRSFYFKTSLVAGSIVQEKDIAYLKPESTEGLHSKEDIVGATVTKDVQRHDLITAEAIKFVKG